MPSRAAILGILIFWCGGVGWFLAREVWPQFATDAPPVFVVDITDEAVRQIVPIRWGILRNGQRLGTLRTALFVNSEDDTFSLNSSMNQIDLIPAEPIRLHLAHFEQSYHVDRSGELLDSHTKVEMSMFGMEIQLLITAVVRNRVAYPTCRLKYPGGVVEPPLEPMAVSRIGVLNPLHPVNRLSGLRVGTRWRIPLNDTLADVQRAAIDGLAKSVLGKNAPPLPRVSAPKFLLAEVNGPLALEQPSGMVNCLVIDYRGDDFRARTWVRVSDGTVLRQEATNAGDEFILQRE